MGGRPACGFIRPRPGGEGGPRSCAPPGPASTRRLSPPVPSLARRKVLGTGINEAARPFHKKEIGQNKAKPHLASPATSNFTLPAQGIDTKTKIIENIRKGRREGKKKGGDEISESPEKQDSREIFDRKVCDVDARMDDDATRNKTEMMDDDATSSICQNNECVQEKKFHMTMTQKKMERVDSKEKTTKRKVNSVSSACVGSLALMVGGAKRVGLHLLFEPTLARLGGHPLLCDPSAVASGSFRRCSTYTSC